MHFNCVSNLGKNRGYSGERTRRKCKYTVQSVKRVHVFNNFTIDLNVTDTWAQNAIDFGGVFHSLLLNRGLTVASLFLS